LGRDRIRKGGAGETHYRKKGGASDHGATAETDSMMDTAQAATPTQLPTIMHFDREGSAMSMKFCAHNTVLSKTIG
jgi:hypothetical protein